ncbi:hypothetical protein D0962_33945 [Leptolyngbyaceae cyanobacterium CCMR0082]|uniref:Uncharacterized protein n=1 Tax=Adonisia turfae CCMR0082 TaxID=2304604 RepID=A0A6M0SGQ8_9CYAN|nr:hypothetical protein [Adonisia turfae]MDV3347972.1 hypothetical protein [Leptothoe sp. LEGE 181152]NEZ67707.1 hypothetical protein [Adonisia turfae CCMR0082]
MVLVPKQRGIQTEVEPIFLPIGEHCLDDGFVESVDVNLAIAEPSSDASLLAPLGKAGVQHVRLTSPA